MLIWSVHARVAVGSIAGSADCEQAFTWALGAAPTLLRRYCRGDGTTQGQILTLQGSVVAEVSAHELVMSDDGLVLAACNGSVISLISMTGNGGRRMPGIPARFDLSSTFLSNARDLRLMISPDSSTLLVVRDRGPPQRAVLVSLITASTWRSLLPDALPDSANVTGWSRQGWLCEGAIHIGPGKVQWVPLLFCLVWQGVQAVAQPLEVMADRGYGRLSFVLSPEYKYAAVMTSTRQERSATPQRRVPAPRLVSVAIRVVCCSSDRVAATWCPPTGMRARYCRFVWAAASNRLHLHLFQETRHVQRAVGQVLLDFS